MIMFEDECVGCPPEMGCLGSGCPNRNIPHFYCDECKDEVGQGNLYKFEGSQLCLGCIAERLHVVTEDDYDED